MITRLSPLRLEYKGVFFQKQSAVNIILGIGLFSSIGCISSIGCGSEGDGVFEVS